jgi:hypothetical protein
MPVDVLTSSRESLDLESCYQLGVNARMVKPVRFVEFVEAVKEIGVFWALVNQPPYSGWGQPGACLPAEGRIADGFFNPYFAPRG